MSVLFQIISKSIIFVNYNLILIKNALKKIELAISSCMGKMNISNEIHEKNLI